MIEYTAIVYFSYAMKKIFLWIICAIFAVMSIALAQNPALTRLYSLLDDVLVSNPAATTIILSKLDELESRAMDPAKVDLIDQIRTYVLTQKTVSARAEIVTVPDGYASVLLSSIPSILETVHELWSDDAPIIVIEFLDFQCPYCKRQHDNKLLSELREVEFPGKVRTAAAMFPLTGKRHEYSQQAAESAECAYIQWGIEAFYDHKTWLYANGIVPTMDIIRRVASNNGLDADQMETCIAEWHGTQWVLAQKNLWISFGVRGTPYSVVLDTRSWAYKLMRGAVPIEVFMDEIAFLYNYK